MKRNSFFAWVQRHSELQRAGKIAAQQELAGAPSKRQMQSMIADQRSALLATTAQRLFAASRKNRLSYALETWKRAAAIFAAQRMTAEANARVAAYAFKGVKKSDLGCCLSVWRTNVAKAQLRGARDRGQSQFDQAQAEQMRQIAQIEAAHEEQRAAIQTIAGAPDRFAAASVHHAASINSSPAVASFPQILTASSPRVLSLFCFICPSARSFFVLSTRCSALRADAKIALADAEQQRATHAEAAAGERQRESEERLLRLRAAAQVWSVSLRTRRLRNLTFQAWRHLAVLDIERRTVVEQVLGHFLHGALAAAFDTWHSWARKKAVAQQKMQSTSPSPAPCLSLAFSLSLALAVADCLFTSPHLRILRSRFLVCYFLHLRWRRSDRATLR